MVLILDPPPSYNRERPSKNRDAQALSEISTEQSLHDRVSTEETVTTG